MVDKEHHFQIKHYREQKNMTQKELAERLRTDIRNVRRWENGESIPNVVDALRISEVLETPFEDIFVV